VVVVVVVVEDASLPRGVSFRIVVVVGLEDDGERVKNMA
tara:strand:- start:342 stop:458 length:117 start_codon:yes stop_codon:yes gene_type:complete